jgi:pimeloyl-ACP methyl ester carboxylesterase
LNLVGESWWNGMTSDNAAAFRMAVDGEKSLRQHLEPTRRRFSSVTGAELSETLGRLVSQVDQASLSEEFADMLAMARRQAANHGIDGWVDDLLAFVRPWGFDPASIQTPTTIWHGEHDSFVPISHGQWLASRIPLAVPQLLAAEGHLSLVARRLDEILRGL